MLQIFVLMSKLYIMFENQIQGLKKISSSLPYKNHASSLKVNMEIIKIHILASQAHIYDYLNLTFYSINIKHTIFKKNNYSKEKRKCIMENIK